MKRILLVCLFSIHAAFSQAGDVGTIKYWDIDDVIPGAGGATPAGTWDTSSANWTTNPSGGSSGTTWLDGDDAVFSAGTDATGAFTNTVSGSQIAGNLTVEEGDITFADSAASLNVGNYATGKGMIDVASGSTATIETFLTGGDDTTLLTKTGTGTLVLSHDNYGGVNLMLIKEGVVVVANDTALGDTITPTTVSNGAALHLSGGRTMGEGITLNGSGVGNTGALRGSTNNSTWGGGVILGSDVRIEAAGARLDFNNLSIEGTNGGNNFNLIIGGDGGRVRCNNATQSPNDVPVNLGTGTFTKEGTTLLQLENTNTCSAFYFNGGDIYPRNESGWAGFGQGQIFVGPSAGNIRASFQDVYLGYEDYNGGYQVSLAAGASLGFAPAAAHTLWVDCTLTGLGGIAKRNTGFAVLTNHHNIYTGNTTVEDGTLILAANSSISNTTVIDIWTNGILDVSGQGTFVLQSAQTIKGNGTVLGNVNAKGTISPGASVGSLTNDGNLTLSGALLIDVDKSLSPAGSNDLITVTGNLTYGGSGGSVTVENLGPALAVGDSFQIFNKAVTGGGTISVTGGGATWANHLDSDGSIAVTAVAPPAVPATNVTIQASGAGSYLLGGLGAASSVYDVYAATNISIPASNWWKIGSTNSTAGGVIHFLDPQATNAQRFYRFGQTVP